MADRDEDIFEIGEILPEEDYRLKTHPLYGHFHNVLKRTRMYGLERYFRYGREYFEEFCKVIGPIPKGMIEPTVGRFDHTKGYVYDTENNRWNFRWQPMSENSRESALRTMKGFHEGTPEQQSEWRRMGRERADYKARTLG